MGTGVKKRYCIKSSPSSADPIRNPVDVTLRRLKRVSAHGAQTKRNDLAGLPLQFLFVETVFRIRLCLDASFRDVNEVRCCLRYVSMLFERELHPLCVRF